MFIFTATLRATTYSKRHVEATVYGTVFVGCHTERTTDLVRSRRYNTGDGVVCKRSLVLTMAAMYIFFRVSFIAVGLLVGWLVTANPLVTQLCAAFGATRAARFALVARLRIDKKTR